MKMPCNSTLSTEISQSIASFLDRNKHLFTNERDLQMHLAIALANEYGVDNVEVEYFIPGETFDKESYPWKQQNKSSNNQDMRIDIVVQRGSEFVPIELKYKTKLIIEDTFERFGKTIVGAQLVKDQSAQDLGRYDFWRDVRRLELLCKKFDKVRNGIAVFLTNDTAYYQKPKEKKKGKVPNCNQFYLTGNNGKSRKWENGTEKKYKPGRPKFCLDNVYDIKWESLKCENTGSNNRNFIYTIVLV